MNSQDCIVDNNIYLQFKYLIYKLLPVPTNFISSHPIHPLFHPSSPFLPSSPAQPSSRRGGLLPLALCPELFHLARPDISVTVLPLHQLPQPTDFLSLFLQLTTIL